MIGADDGTSIGDSKNLLLDKAEFFCRRAYLGTAWRPRGLRRLDDFWWHGHDFIYWIPVARLAINLYWIPVALVKEIQLSLPHNWMINPQVNQKC